MVDNLKSFSLIEFVNALANVLKERGLLCPTVIVTKNGECLDIDKGICVDLENNYNLCLFIDVDSRSEFFSKFIDNLTPGRQFLIINNSDSRYQDAFDIVSEKIDFEYNKKSYSGLYCTKKKKKGIGASSDDPSRGMFDDDGPVNMLIYKL